MYEIKYPEVPGVYSEESHGGYILAEATIYEGGAAHMTSPEFIQGFFEQPSHSSPGGRRGGSDTSATLSRKAALARFAQSAQTL